MANICLSNMQVIDANIPGAQYVTDTLLGRVPLTPKPSLPMFVPPKPVIKESPPQQAPSKQTAVKDAPSEKKSPDEAPVKQTMDKEKKKEKAALPKSDDSALQGWSSRAVVCKNLWKKIEKIIW